MELFIIIGLFVALIVFVSLFLGQASHSRALDRIIKDLRASSIAASGSWSESYKAVNQKLNDANARLAADKPFTELGMKRQASMEKAEAKRKADRAAKAKTKAK